ncbi:MAG: Tat pathway signal protein [Duodenibacillus sp.]|nr:Tat pathway signal protein [Duodenibacillus sp.]
MPQLNRRRALALGALALAAAGAQARPASVPPIWDGKKMWESFEKDATGFSYPGPAGRRKAWVAFDPQCPDCIRLMERMAPLAAKVEAVWCPISYLNIHSEPQGTAMLIAEKPWELLDKHHEHFRDADFRGIRYDVSKLPEAVRDKVWTNTKLHRRCGCRAVPYGVYKSSQGEYRPFDENLTTEELAELFEVTP